MKVYRIEDSAGYGPYRGRHDMSAWSRRDHNDWHPTPLMEGLPISGRLCGFKSLYYLKKWFTPHELMRLKRLGYSIKKVEAKEVCYGKNQLTFKRVKK